MNNKFICGGNKFELGGGDAHKTIGLPISIAGLPPKITVEGCELIIPQNSPQLCCGDECGVRERGRGNGSFPAEESSESASVENREVLKINSLAEYLAESARIGRVDLLLRLEFHISLVYTKEIIERHKISIPNFADKAVEDFCNYIQTNEINLLKYRNEFRFVSKSEKRSVVVMCDISNLAEFFDLINKKYNLHIEYPPTHVTLYTLSSNVVGIFLADSKDLREFTKVIANPTGVDL